jgi:hypothetical protein
MSRAEREKWHSESHPNQLGWQEQLDIISQLCNERYSVLVEGGSGSALLAFHAQPSHTAGVIDIRRQDHPEVHESMCMSGFTPH